MAALYPRRASARGTTGGAAKPGQLRHGLSGLAGKRARQPLQPFRSSGRRPEPCDARASPRAFQLLGRASRFTHLAEPEIAGGALQRIEQPPPLRELAGDVELRLLLAEAVVLGAGAEGIEEARFVLDLGAHPCHEESRVELRGHQRGL